MKIRFWGVRGSLPTPISPANLKSKISSIVQRIAPADIVSQEARERFLARLPDYLFSTIGGNTACVEIVTEENCHIVFDAGTGIRNLGQEIAATKKPTAVHLFFSHFHWDHVQGLPFFGPAFDSRSYIAFYSPDPDLKAILEGQMRSPYFPIGLDAMGARKEFVQLHGEGVRVGGVRIHYRSMSHPGGCYSYALEEGGRKVIYSTDTELDAKDFDRSPENERYFGDADALIIDAQYTLGEAIEKQYWGHSSFSLAADFAASWRIKRLILFHHEPSYNDRKIESILKSAAWYLSHMEERGVSVVLAREGLELEI
ncbi:MAG TPA: MBL fold metallo-hydrolase [Spirochaetaceae bacterium]|jgi:phosphoribosyl 1,2-cyclic phosphodiesterase|nr:MBL fold metallo-hydrolase [Spirochaetaceae bacterium]